MSGFNQNIDKSLELLYDHSSHFNLSIDLIQKLAQQLKLDTFKDKDAYTHVTTTSSDSNFKRLSIAGSLILIDIDFIDDNTILKVSLSLANHSDDGNSTDAKLSPIIGKEGTDISTFLVKLNGKSNNLSLIGKSAELILLQNLTDKSKKLVQFPANLRYLSSLDRLSLPQLDLFVYLDRLVKVLYSVNEIENVKEEWEFPFTSSIGKALANDSESGKLGVFLKFWQDYRYINHQAASEIAGNLYKLLLRISDLKEGTEALGGDLLKESWNIGGSQYLFTFDDDDQHQQPTSSSGSQATTSSGLQSTAASGSLSTGGTSASLINKFLLHLDINRPVILPKSVLQYLDLYSYSETGFNKKDKVFTLLNKYKDVQCSNGGPAGLLVIRQDFPNEYVAVDSVSVKSLTAIARVVPVLRNFAVFRNLIGSLAKLSTQFECYSLENETENTSKKTLKETLNLAEGSDELLGLSLSAENPILSSIQSIKPNEVDLDTFMEVEASVSEKNDEDQEDASSGPPKTLIQLLVEDVDLTSPTLDVILSIYGNVESEAGKSTEFDVKFKISNGQIQPLGEDVDMVGENASERFVKALNLTEDIQRCIEYIYK